jgi:hypothetical protein
MAAGLDLLCSLAKPLNIPHDCKRLINTSTEPRTKKCQSNLPSLQSNAFRERTKYVTPIYQVDERLTFIILGQNTDVDEHLLPSTWQIQVHKDVS